MQVTRSSAYMLAQSSGASRPAHLCRLNELVPPGAWDALDVSTLERAIADLEYRDNELRAEHKVVLGVHRYLTKWHIADM